MQISKKDYSLHNHSIIFDDKIFNYKILPTADFPQIIHKNFLFDMNIFKHGGYMKIIKIKMRQGCRYSQNVIEIDSVYIEGSQHGYYKKEVVHNHLLQNPGTIQSGAYPYPDVIPAISINGEKYIKTVANEHGKDNLLSLPRE